MCVYIYIYVFLYMCMCTCMCACTCMYVREMPLSNFVWLSDSASLNDVSLKERASGIAACGVKSPGGMFSALIL